MATKRIHPADLENARIVANAVRFEISLFLGTGEFARAEAPTKEEAEQAARDMKAHYSTCSRFPMIYAVDERNRSAPIPYRSALASSRIR
jgi:hypothetical protein